MAQFRPSCPLSNMRLMWCVIALGSSLLASATDVDATDVTYMDGEDSLLGHVATPAGASKLLPAVLHVHTWAGLSEFEKQRAQRTASELGYIGFAVSIYDADETAQAATGMQARMPLLAKYQGSPEMLTSRLGAAVDYIKTWADASKIAAVGYCFGGTTVLQFALQGGAASSGISGVVSFHGSLNSLSYEEDKKEWNNTKVLVLNGYADSMIPKQDIDVLQASLTDAGVTWEFSNYGRAEHGFTHPKDDTEHFHYDAAAEERSWASMSDFLDTSLGFKDDVSKAQSEIMTEQVTYMDGDVALSGYLAYPLEASVSLPVVLHVHTWAGLTDFEQHRAERTAEELGYIGFAVSIYDMDESAQAATGMQARFPILGKYGGNPELLTSRLGAAVDFVKQHEKADASKIAAVGYCFGGSTVLQFARVGGAEAHGVVSVASFHGGLSNVVGMGGKFCPTRVAVYNGAVDAMIPDAEIEELQQTLERTGTYWELTNYSFANHGFTHPTEAGNPHFEFEQTAESRSWVSMTHFLMDSFAGKGRASSADCVEVMPEGGDAKEPTGGWGGGGSMVDDDDMGDGMVCADDEAGLEQVAGAWGIKTCDADGVCTGPYKDMVASMCMKTCGLCPSREDKVCADDNAALKEMASAWGLTACDDVPDLCTGPYKDMVASMCMKTCGLCPSPGGGSKGDKMDDGMVCADDEAALKEMAGAWGITTCDADLCTGAYKDMVASMCMKTCGLCPSSGGGMEEDPKKGNKKRTRKAKKTRKSKKSKNSRKGKSRKSKQAKTTSKRGKKG